MSINTLLITPPFTQLNTAYPATAYIKGFLNSKNVKATQMDLSIGLFTAVFTKEFINAIFVLKLYLYYLLFLLIPFFF